MVTGINLLGGFAATLTTLSFFPQAWKVYRTHQVEDISLWMWIIFIIGITGWCVYGFFIVDWNLIVANGITGVLSVYILFMKIRYTPAKKPAKSLN